MISKEAEVSFYDGDPYYIETIDKIINVSLGLKLPAGDISYENVSAVGYATIIYVK